MPQECPKLWLHLDFSRPIAPPPFTLGLEPNDYEVVMRQAVTTWCQLPNKNLDQLEGFASIHYKLNMQDTYRPLFRHVVPDSYPLGWDAEGFITGSEKRSLDLGWKPIYDQLPESARFDAFIEHYFPRMLAFPLVDTDSDYPNPERKVLRLRFDRMLIQHIQHHFPSET